MVLSNDVDVIFASRKGNYLGTMLSHARRYRPARISARLAASDGPQASLLGRAIVVAKITKQQVLLERLNRRPGHERVAESLIRMVPDANSPMELMGLEGAAAKFYFPCLGQLMPELMRFWSAPASHPKTCRTLPCRTCTRSCSASA